MRSRSGKPPESCACAPRPQQTSAASIDRPLGVRTLCCEPLTLAILADEPLVRPGDCASNIMGDTYLRTKHWSALLHAHANPKVDGLAYRSRFRTQQFCIALFDRAIAPSGLATVHERSIDPATSREVQTIMKRYRVVPT